MSTNTEKDSMYIPGTCQEQTVILTYNFMENIPQHKVWMPIPSFPRRCQTDATIIASIVGAVALAGMAGLIMFAVGWRRRGKSNQKYPQNGIDLNPVYGTYGYGETGEAG